MLEKIKKSGHHAREDKESGHDVGEDREIRARCQRTRNKMKGRIRVRYRRTRNKTKGSNPGAMPENPKQNEGIESEGLATEIS